MKLQWKVTGTASRVLEVDGELKRRVIRAQDGWNVYDISGGVRAELMAGSLPTYEAAVNVAEAEFVEWQPPADIDSEVIELCRALNVLPGIRTTSSCCGHATRPFEIAFLADSLDDLPEVAYWFDVCHCGCLGWRVVVITDCAMSLVKFVIEGPVGERAYSDAMAIAHLMRKALEGAKCSTSPQ